MPNAEQGTHACQNRTNGGGFARHAIFLRRETEQNVFRQGPDLARSTIRTNKPTGWWRGERI